MSTIITNTREKGPKIALFQSERELQAKLATLDLQLKETHSITFFRREVPVGACIPDLIYVRFADKPDPYLWPRQWTFRHSFAIWLLRQEKALSLDALADRFFESPEGRIRQTVRDLVRSGAVLEAVPNTFELSEAMHAVNAEVIAVEVKLSKWKRALEQAQDYMRFADKVFVAMDAELIPRRKSILEQFGRLGIGLCAVLPKNVEWLVMPQFHPGTKESDREYIVTSAASHSRQTLWSTL